MNTEQLAQDMKRVVNEAYRELSGISNVKAQQRPTDGGWSAKEIIGHLIDSASNNHQRWVRLHLSNPLDFPDYAEDNEKWVQVQHYNDQPWAALLILWRHYNLHLANIINRADDQCLNNKWIAENSTNDLKSLMVDYVKHLKIHLDQIQDI